MSAVEPLPSLASEASSLRTPEAREVAPWLTHLRARGAAFVREHLVGFVLAGLALAGLEALARPDELEVTPASRVLVVDASVRRGLTEDLRHTNEREPTAAELDTALEAWIDEELLYREGLARELDRDDPRVRARVATLASSLLEAEHPLAEPTEDELRAYFEAHLDRYAEEARIDFEQVFVAGTDVAARARAEALLAELARGASPIGLGDTYPGGRHYRGRRLADLDEAFGPGFSAGLFESESAWSLHGSVAGWHLVRVERRTAASAADFDRARLDVAHDLLEERREARSTRARAELRERWQVIER
ncbi:MAG: peptidyl-prolyl cis-trans isomerase [Sandaracinaceae bacterium]|nr:peptidyl-prolyl cis-trans isomerase [Sandaracinaceae bacterium]